MRWLMRELCVGLLGTGARVWFGLGVLGLLAGLETSLSLGGASEFLYALTF